MARPKGASWKQRAISSMKHAYRSHVEAWQGMGYIDDRDVFLRTYHMILRGLQSLPAEPDLSVRVAVGDKLRKDRAMMDRIAARFDRLAAYEAARG